MNIAIVAVTYNRIVSLKRLLDSLENAYFEYPVTLVISVDKSNSDEVECFADGFFWSHGEKIVDRHSCNLGLRAHMLSLGKWFEKFDAIVVLEDDIVVSPNFFYYTEQTVEQYYDNPEIAGISLYSIYLNYHTGIPFVPQKNQHDAYFMNCAMSWGEVWMRYSWNKFYEWYQSHKDFPSMPHLPNSICSWNDKSWLKYHTRYCIEENKFFVHPYTSLTTNFGDAGVHSSGGVNTTYQVPLQQGKKEHYILPEFGEDAVYYDGFFENISLYEKLGIEGNELCLDLNGEWKNRLRKRYWLTTEVQNYKIVKSFGLNYRPIEMNVFLENQGNDIFLYDTSTTDNNNLKKKSDLLYHYHIIDMFFFVRRYGFGNLFSESIKAVKNKLKALL